MSIGMCFNNDEEAVIFPPKTPRNGMSVKEIHEALHSLERLEEAFQKQRAECDNLHMAIFKAVSYNSATAETYKRVASLCDNDVEKAEFLGKAAGLREANLMLKKYMKGDKSE